MENQKKNSGLVKLVSGAIILLGINVGGYHLNYDIAKTSCEVIELNKGRNVAIKTAQGLIENTNDFLSKIIYYPARQGYLDYISKYQ